MNAAAPQVFISYRREETAGHAGRLYDAIAARFGDRNVFMDVDLAPGIDFVEQITETVGSCDVLLVVMGPRWATPSDGQGAPRLADPNDFVRLEVETALRRPNVKVIPLLVAGARMAAPDELPESVRALSRRNALELSDLRWRYDVGRLVSTLLELLEGPTGASEVAAPTPTPEQPGPPAPPPLARRTRRTFLSAIAAALAVGVGAAVLALAGVFSGENDEGGADSTENHAARLVREYERLYEAKDLDGLRRLLDPRVVLRKGKQLELQGTNEVIAQYRHEFRRFGKQKPTFEWENAYSDSQEEDSEVSGPYVISADDGRRETGRFGFLVRTIGSEALITEMCFRCPDLRRPGGLRRGTVEKL